MTLRARFGVLIAGMLIMSCGGKKAEKNTDVIVVESEEVAGTNDFAGRSYVGEVEAEASTAVSFNGSGMVLKVYVEEGQRVSKGQVLAQIDATQSKNALNATEAMLAQAQDAYNRMKVLHEQNSVSEMDWVEVQSKLQQAKSSVEISKKNVADCILKAPCSGVVGNKQIEPGVVTLPAMPICNILYINKVKVRISVPEKEIGSFAPSMLGGVGITVGALDGKAYYPHKIEKGVQADALSRTYNVWFVVNNPDGKLLPGMVADVRVAGNGNNASADVISVPVRSVQQGADGKHFVWCMLNGKAHRQGVTLGSASGNRIEITSGLKKGDRIITAGYQKVSEGTMVKGR